MKILKGFILSLVLLSSTGIFAQQIPPQYLGTKDNIVIVRNAMQVLNYLKIPVKDTLGNAFTDSVGAITMRPQDLHAYVSNGEYWIDLHASGGGGGSGDSQFRDTTDSDVYLPLARRLGINGKPHASTMFDVISTTKASRPAPRMTQAQMVAISSPAPGACVTNSDSSNRIFVYTGSDWKGLSFTSENVNFYNVDGTLSSNRVVNGNGTATLRFQSMPSFTVQGGDYVRVVGNFINGLDITPTVVSLGDNNSPRTDYLLTMGGVNGFKVDYENSGNNLLFIQQTASKAIFSTRGLEDDETNTMPGVRITLINSGKKAIFYSNKTLLGDVNIASQGFPSHTLHIQSIDSNALRIEAPLAEGADTDSMLTRSSDGSVHVRALTSGGSGATTTGAYDSTRKNTDSLTAHNLRIGANTTNIALKLNISDTTGMLLAYKTKVQKNTDSLAAHRTQIDNLNLLSYTNVRLYGAVGDGTTNDQAAFAAAVAATPDRGILYIPYGDYLVGSTVSINKRITVMGNGSCRIKVTGNFAAFTLDSTSVTIKDVNFHGSGKAGANTLQMGINCNSFYDFNITNCKFDSINGTAINFLATTVSSARYGGRISNCWFNLNNVGIMSTSKGEFVTITGGTAKFNTKAIVIQSGNVVVSNMAINDNGYGIQVNNGTNNGHSTISSCLINHNTSYNVQINDDALGMVFSGCQIFDSYIHVKNSRAVLFDGCEIAPIAFYFENSTGTRFSNNVLYTGYGFTINNNYNSTTSETVWLNNQFLGSANSGIYGGRNTLDTATATIQLGPGTATWAPFKFTSGTNLTTTQAGAVEFDGTHLYFSPTNGGTRYQLDQQTGAGGVTTLAPVGSSPNVNGGTISSNTYNSEPASASFGGVVSTTTQTFAGDKTFTGTITFPTPFTLGVTSVTSTAAQLNYLNAATGTTGTTSTNLVYSGAPTLGTSVTVPLVIGGTSTISNLSLQPTSAAGVYGSDIIAKVGNNGATESFRVVPSGQVRFNAGSAAVPSITIRGPGTDTATGFYGSATNTIGLSITGTARYTFDASRINSVTTSGFSIARAAGNATTPTYSFLGSTNYGMWSDASTLRLTTAGTDAITISSSQNVTAAGTMTATQFKLSALNTAPSSSSDTGTTGEIRIVNGFIYVCVATNTWQRSTLSTF